MHTTTATPEPPPYQSDYWNEDGGRRWVRNIEHTEGMLAGVSEVLLSQHGPAAGERVLDVGCGGGETSAQLAERVGPQGYVVGVDISAIILDVAQRRYTDRSNLEFLLADAAVEDLGAGRFDLVYSRLGIMFFADPVAAFARLRRALKEHGRLAFLCWQDRESNPWLTRAAAAAFEFVPAPPPPEPDAPGPYAFADPRRMQRILSAAGFARIRIEPLNFSMAMGSLDDAMDFLINMGPAAEPLSKAEPGQRALAIAAMRRAMAAYNGPQGVCPPGAAWIVSAAATTMHSP